MRKLILALLATAALALPAGAFAHGGHGHHGRASFGVRFTAVQHGLKLGWYKHATFRHARSNDGDDDDTAQTSAGVFEKLTGASASFGSTSLTTTGTIAGRPLASGSYSATLATDWSKATANDRGGSCAPATATVTLTDASSSASTLATSVTGQTCSVASNDRGVAYVFFGKTTVTSATGTLSGVAGTGRMLLVQKTDGTVKGFEFAGFSGRHEKQLTTLAAFDKKSCDGDGH